MRRFEILALALSVCALGCTSSNPGVPTDGGADGADAQTTTCGNGVLDPGEQCDDGNTMNGDGCQADCTFTCLADTQCDDHDPCNGSETCTGQHTCMSGTGLADGTACGTGKICKGQVCGGASCGDGIVTAPEECDDGNATNGDGCDTDCKWSCVSTDPTRNCTPADACTGAGTCDDATHVCTPGAPLPDDTHCPQNVANYCKGGVCTMPMCGNKIVEPGEDCDDGNVTNGDGCDSCHFSCSDPATDCKSLVVPACQMAACDTMHKCAAVADPSQNTKSCGSNLVCNNGSCAAPTAVCGNGIVESGEACDFGAQNGPNAGCEKGVCTFSCTTTPNSCDDNNPCNGQETCGPVTAANGDMGQKCSPGTPEKDGTSCGGANICVGGMCGASRCGDGYVDASKNEECDPPNGTTCIACLIVKCGNNRRDPGEQCDDNNTTNLDGCDSSCQFEQDQRANSLTMLFAADTYCTANQLGGAIVGGTAQSQLQSSLNTGIKDGTTTILLRMLGLDDLSGTSDMVVNVGVVTGAPVAAPTYDGTNDVDWWYTVDASGIDANRIPTAQLAGGISGQKLTAGPGNVTVGVVLGGSPASLRMSNTKLRATTGMVSTPIASTTMMTPGHLASENLDPSLQSYQVSTNGELCGNVSVASLAQVPIPMALAQNCDEGYVVGTNHLLDALVGGCTVFRLFAQINPTQPDPGLDDPGAPSAGAGPPYTLVENSKHVVTACKDKNNATVSLSACEADAVYSSAFDFTTDRVIIK